MNVEYVKAEMRKKAAEKEAAYEAKKAAAKEELRLLGIEADFLMDGRRSRKKKAAMGLPNKWEPS